MHIYTLGCDPQWVGSFFPKMHPLHWKCRVLTTGTPEYPE